MIIKWVVSFEYLSLLKYLKLREKAVNRTAIVIGATGVVGDSLVTQLIGADHIDKIVTLTRRPVEYSSIKVTNHVVDFEHLDNYAALFNADILFSCLGTTLKQAGSIEAQRKVDLDYQFNAAQLAVNNGVSHYLLVSSSGAKAGSRSAYLNMKGELELKIKMLSFERISIFQPSLLLGKRDDFRIGEIIGSWVMPTLCLIPGLRGYRPISGEQVAKKMVAVSQQLGAAVQYYKLDEIF